MKTMLSSRKCLYLTRGTVLLVTVALIAGPAGCGSAATPTPIPIPAPTQYSLTIYSTDGGLVTTAG